MDDGPTQLVLGGGEVRHPPPRPKAFCPDCDKLITITADNRFHAHNIYKDERCPMAGERLRTA